MMRLSISLVALKLSTKFNYKQGFSLSIFNLLIKPIKSQGSV